MKQNKIVKYFIANIFISILLTLILWYTDGFVKGLIFIIHTLLFAPGFFLITFAKGLNQAMHFTTQKTYYIYSFISYILIIGFIQFAYFFIKKPKSKKSKDS